MFSYGLIILVSLFGNGLVLGIILRSVFIIDSSVYAAKCLVQCIMHRSVFSTIFCGSEKKINYLVRFQKITKLELFFRTRRLHTMTNLFIANLSLGDLLMTAFNIPFTVVR
jgi:hypothetical protein